VVRKNRKEEKEKKQVVDKGRWEALLQGEKKSKIFGNRWRGKYVKGKKMRVGFRKGARGCSKKT